LYDPPGDLDGLRSDQPLGFGLVNGLLARQLATASPSDPCAELHHRLLPDPSTPRPHRHLHDHLAPPPAIIPPSSDVSVMFASRVLLTSAMRIFMA
jgi:hypothetical protein